jgi:hypothetical protein
MKIEVGGLKIKSKIMAKNTAWGNNAYKEVRHSGGSKAEAREASANASKAYGEHTQARQFNGRSSDNDVSDFSNSANDGAWHTAKDL